MTGGLDAGRPAKDLVVGTDGAGASGGGSSQGSGGASKGAGVFVPGAGTTGPVSPLGTPFAVEPGPVTSRTGESVDEAGPVPRLDGDVVLSSGPPLAAKTDRLFPSPETTWEGLVWAGVLMLLGSGVVVVAFALQRRETSWS
ncbi:hypothetical protein [Nocardioides pacificus]